MFGRNLTVKNIESFSEHNAKKFVRKFHFVTRSRKKKKRKYINQL